MGFRTIHWGIIGCGDVCETKSGPAFQKADHSDLSAVMRRDAAKAEDFARRHGVPRWYSDADALIADPGVDAVYVATPPDTHALYALKAAEAGKPVYVEKPMARNHAECLAMIEGCRRAGVPLFTAYYRRRLPRFLKAKEILEQGGIGEVRTVSVTFNQAPGERFARKAAPPWRVVPEISGGGLFLDLASHTLDILDFLLGPIAEAKGLAANLSGDHAVEDAVAAAFSFASGPLGAGTWSFTSHEREDRCEISGSKGRLSFATFGESPIRWTTAEGTREFPIANPPHIQQPLIQSIVMELNGEGRCPSTGESGARTNWVMDGILKDYRASRS
jgi:1,5-anhydro-D-fructose reductase (1,5-anhydro-D-mannitol-forming)